MSFKFRKLILFVLFISLFSPSLWASTAFDAPMVHGPQRKLTSLNAFGSLKVAVWNIYKGSNFFYEREFKDLAAQADLLLMQEVLLHPDKKSLLNGEKNKAWVMAEAWKKRGISTGTLMMSVFRFFLPMGFLSPDSEPIANTPKSSVAFLIPVQNQNPLLVVNTHAINFTSGGPFQRQVEQMFELISKHSGPVIWAGDFNTWSGGRRKILSEFVRKLGLSGVSFDGDPRFMILDHVFVRGLHVVNAQVLTRYESSDHWPLMTELVFHSFPNMGH